MIDREYEKSLGPTAGQVNTAYAELCSLFVDTITSGRLDELLPFGDKSLAAHEVFAAEVGEKDWREIIRIVAACRNILHFTDEDLVNLFDQVGALIEQLAADYADCQAHDYAASKL